MTTLLQRSLRSFASTLGGQFATESPGQLLRIIQVEPDLLFPLIKGASDFSRAYFNKKHNLFAFVPNRAIVKSAYEESLLEIGTLPKTAAYFKTFENQLRQRSTFKGRMVGAPYYAIYNVGEYTFSPWKVIWAEQKDFCAAVVSSADVPLAGEKPFIPDHKIFFADFQSPEPAYFLCGLLNSDIVIEYIKSHIISIQIGNIFKHMQLPQYDSNDNKHNELVQITRQCHLEADDQLRGELIQQLSKLAEEIMLNI